MQDLASTPDELERLARRRARAKMGWYTHALVYLAVNIGLALLSGLHGRSWAIYPALGWGLGLLIHGALVFLVLPGNDLHTRLLEQERARLRQQRNTH